jgi:hypothetical protein
MTIEVLPEEAAPLFVPEPFKAAADLWHDRAHPPPTSGVYAWYFNVLPPEVLAAGSHVHGEWTLLYVGIAPSAPTGSSTLRKRLRSHFRGDASRSTLRLTLGCLLGLELRRVLEGSKSRMMFAGGGEPHLSEWIAEHARVSWITHATPWELEGDLISKVNLSLNVDRNSHPFVPTLRALRDRAREHARSLPVLDR